MRAKSVKKVVATIAPSGRKAPSPAAQPIERTASRFKPEPWGQHLSSGDRVLSVNVDKVARAIKPGEGARMAKIYRERDAHAAAQAQRSSIAAAQRAAAARAVREHAPVHPVEPAKPKPLLDKTVSLLERVKALGPHSKPLKAIAAADNDFEAKHPRVPPGQGDKSGEFTHKGGAGGGDQRTIKVPKGWSRKLPEQYATAPSPEQAMLGKGRKKLVLPKTVRGRLNTGWRDPATGAMIPKVHGANMKKQTVNASTKAARATVTISDKIFKRKKK